MLCDDDTRVINRTVCLSDEWSVKYGARRAYLKRLMAWKKGLCFLLGPQQIMKHVSKFMIFRLVSVWYISVTRRAQQVMGIAIALVSSWMVLTTDKKSLTAWQRLTCHGVSSLKKKKLSCPVLYLHSHLPYSPSMSTHMKQYLCHWRTLAVVFSRKGDQLAPLHPYNCLFTHCRCLPKSRLVHAHAYASPHPNFCRHVSDHLGYKPQSLTMSSFYTNNSCTCTGCP